MGELMAQSTDTGATFPTLSEGQISFLQKYGTTRETVPGQTLFEEGDTSYDFIVILDGSVDIVENFGGEDRTIATHGAGRFLGEMNMLTGQAVYLSAVVEEAGEVLEISTGQPARDCHRGTNPLGHYPQGLSRPASGADERRHRVAHSWLSLLW